MIKNDFDIDIDCADRDKILALIKHTPASQWDSDDNLVKHNTGVYVQPIPKNIFIGAASIDYEVAEDLGYIKLDFLNNSVYQKVRDQQHLEETLKQRTPWEKLDDHEFVAQLVHISGYWRTIQRLPEPITSTRELAMFIALLRPAKKHLMGYKWNRLENLIWEKSTDGTYGYKKSHATAYAVMIELQMKLVNQGIKFF